MKRIYNNKHKRYLEEFDACELCGKHLELELHHIVPMCIGGSDKERNWIAICRRCHSRLTPKVELSEIVKCRKGRLTTEFYDYIEKNPSIDGIFNAVESILFGEKGLI